MWMPLSRDKLPILKDFHESELPVDRIIVEIVFLWLIVQVILESADALLQAQQMRTS